MSGEDRIQELERRHTQCNHEVSMHLAASGERWINQANTNRRLERCMEALKQKISDQDMKIRAIENKVAWWAGSAAMLGTVIGTVILPLIKHIFLP